MKQVYRIDDDGYYIEPHIIYPRIKERETEVTPETFEEEEEDNVTSKPYVMIEKYELYDVPDDCVEMKPPSYFCARWLGDEWMETGTLPETLPQPPTLDEKVATLERDNRLLRLQNDTLSDQYQFLEDVITEMIVATLP